MLLELLDKLIHKPTPSDLLREIRACSDCIQASSELVKDELWVNILTWADLSSLDSTRIDLSTKEEKVIVNLIEFATER